MRDAVPSARFIDVRERPQRHADAFQILQRELPHTIRVLSDAGRQHADNVEDAIRVVRLAHRGALIGGLNRVEDIHGLEAELP